MDRNPDDCSGTVHMFAMNLIETATGCVTDSSLGNYDFLNSEAFIGPLRDNGGPTWTHALLNGSHAIDQGSGCLDNNVNTLTTDQRGAERPLDGTGLGSAICDIGAFEYRPPVYLPSIMR